MQVKSADCGGKRSNGRILRQTPCLEPARGYLRARYFTVISDKHMTHLQRVVMAVNEWKARGEVRRTLGDAGSTDSSAAERVGHVITKVIGGSPQTHVGL